MDFIERLFGVSPDGGDGSTELMWLAALLLVLVLVRSRGAIRAFLDRRSKR